MENVNELNMKFNEDIFIIDCWPDTESKENDLITLIGTLKEFEIPIILSGHYPVKPEIQKMVDYYIYDNENPVLYEYEYEKYNISDRRWCQMDNWKIENMSEFHHDYAIWTTMRNSFNLAKNLGKKYIHFLEYDNNPDPVQYRQAFLEYVRNYNAVIYEYDKNSTFNGYCATYIFSIKTDIALDVISKINSRDEYFTNRPEGWQLERIFYKYLKESTNSVFVSKYVPNSNELNTQAVWNRNGISRNGAKFSAYTGTDKNGKLYINFVSGFYENPANKDYLVEINYGKIIKFYTIKNNESTLLDLGNYHINEKVQVFYQGVLVYDELLSQELEDFHRKNKVTFTTIKMEKSQITHINHNFIDGPFFEILGSGDEEYRVEFFNETERQTEFTLGMKVNNWARASKKYYVNWRINLFGNGINETRDMDLTNKRVLIGFESSSIGDTLSWIPYVEEFRIKHNCEVICSTFHNKMFKEVYPEITFVPPGSVITELTAAYRIGIFIKDKDKSENGIRVYDAEKHPSDPKKLPLQKVASDILGLEFKEIKPRLKKFDVPKKKRVTLGFHSTAQTKYWNNPEGWQEVVDYLNNRGYEVVILSREKDGYMGNSHPKGAIQFMEGDLNDVIQKLTSSELFIGVSSGLAWLSWASDVPTILISGFTTKETEPSEGVYRVINENVCHGCWSNSMFDPGEWFWCPHHKGTDRQFECTKTITGNDVIKEIEKIIGKPDILP